MKFLRTTEQKRPKKPIGFKAAGDASIGIGFGKEIKGKASIGLAPVGAEDTSSPALRKVFITHGNNRSFIEPVKKLLATEGLEPIVSIELQSVAQPLTDKVMTDMKSCQAAIIHIDDEKRLLDDAGKRHIVPNANVLIEVGVALALYGHRFVLLVKEGIELPSNLKGLYEVRYTGNSLDEPTAVRLAQAIQEMKK